MKVVLGKPSPPTDLQQQIYQDPSCICGLPSVWQERLAFSSLSASLTPSGVTRPD